ncbi:YuzL family protein [Bacillus toyonensis]|nr:YuzL family protein [Bacillus toyonensis]
MSKKVKKDHSRSILGSPEVEGQGQGQGTTTHETGSHKVSSSNKKQKRS